VLYLLRTADQASVASVILRRVGRLYFDDGDFEAGLDALTASIAVAESLGDASLVAYANNVLGIGYWQRGLLNEAERLYRVAYGAARAAGDTKLRAMLDQNLGIIAQTRGDIAGALRHYEASLAGYRTLGLDDFCAKVLANIALAYTRLERWAEAESAHQEALAICAACGDVTTALMVEGNRAEAQIARKRFVEAEVLCARILRRARVIEDARAQAEAQKYLGIILRERGRHTEAEKYLRDAAEAARGREDLLLAAEVAREQAELYSNLGRHRETLQCLTSSHRLFTALSASRDLLDVARSMRRLEMRFDEIVTAWARSIEAKDPYTLGHCERVAEYACALARAYGVADDSLFWFRLGAVLHDVGKLEVPLPVLNKTSKLTAEERTLVERHPVAGVELLRDIEFPWDVLPMVRNHHERWDGTGYPDRLSGDAIPLHARILCVADVFDALTTDRPYRVAFSREEAIRMMRSDAGRMFDPSIFAVFEELLPSLSAVDHARGISLEKGNSAPAIAA
jgi:putative nucleotidyltransferase with HDIG domain